PEPMTQWVCIRSVFNEIAARTIVNREDQHADTGRFGRWIAERVTNRIETQSEGTTFPEFILFIPLNLSDGIYGPLELLTE
ncbi:MAG: hypothetical protein ACREE6_08495, partial [Limisphaerales bacterium]